MDLRTVRRRTVVRGLFVAPRIPTRIKIKIDPPPEERSVTVHTWHEGEWVKEPVDTLWRGQADNIELVVLFRRLIVTKRIKVAWAGKFTGSYHVFPKVANHPYKDIEHIATAHECENDEEFELAIDHLQECLKVEPKHYIASMIRARIAVAQEQWSDAQHWAMHACAHSRGHYGEDLLCEACKNGLDDLSVVIPPLREAAQSWDVGGHFGTVCLSHEQDYRLGFERFHFKYCRQILEVRRQAAARLLRHLHFDFTTGKEKVIFAQLRILRSDGTTIVVPEEHIAVVDHEQDIPSIRSEGQRRALYHCPELARGDCLELYYLVLRGHPTRGEGTPDFFVMADLNCDFPTWTSRVTITTPSEWTVRCIGTNGAPDPEECVTDNGDKSYQSTMERLYYDEWGVNDIERKYRSPHLCCSWGDRSWADIAELGRHEFCHVPREDTLPDPLRRAIEPYESTEDKLRAGFEWIRDRLKYMSLKSAKERTGDPELAAKIVAAGVGDCMDRAYLLSLLCQELGLESENVVTASAGEYVVTDLPAQQFDHILVRVRLNDRWVYLDATSSETPFGWTPRYLQGLPVLSLNDGAQLVTVPEETPEANQISLTEHLRCDADGRMRGQFEMMALGMPAMWWDGHWKGTTMSVDDPMRVARMALKRQMPTANVINWEIAPYESNRERFILFGEHERHKMHEIGNERFGVISWRTEMFQLYYAKDRNWVGTTMFPLPLRY